MPRSGAVYNLPSPPYPFAPSTPALAEDQNTIFEDIATALTNSMGVDGAASWNGDVNANNHNLGGVGTLSAAVVNAGSAVNTPNLNVWGGATIASLTLNGDLNMNGHQIYGVSNLYASNTIQTNGAMVAGWMHTTGDIQVDATMRCSSGVVNGDLWVNGTIHGNYGDINCGNVWAGGTVQGGYLHSTGAVAADGAVNTGGGVSYQGQAPVGIWWDGYKYLTDHGGDRSESLVVSGPGGGANLRVCYLQANTGGVCWVGAADNASYFIAWQGTTSDRRSKSAIAPAGDALAVVQAVPVHEADYQPTPEAAPQHLDFALIADEVDEHAPFAVLRAPVAGGMDGLTPLHLCATLWRAVQQLTERVAALEAAR